MWHVCITCQELKNEIYVLKRASFGQISVPGPTILCGDTQRIHSSIYLHLSQHWPDCSSLLVFLEFSKVFLTFTKASSPPHKTTTNKIYNQILSAVSRGAVPTAAPRVHLLVVAARAVHPRRDLSITTNKRNKSESKELNWQETYIS